MESYKEKFIEFMVRSNVLTFGEFVTKSGRKTPFFVNTGNYSNGERLAAAGRFYAETLQRLFPERIDVLFGPAYKGIPLATATAISLSVHFSRNAAVCFNRKEIKDHGEGGTLVGHIPCDGDNVVIVEDVVTAGTSIRETIPMLRTAAKVNIIGLVVSVDRMERGRGAGSALAELSREFGVRTAAIVTLTEIIEYLYNRSIDGKIILDDAMYEKITEYRKDYGAIQ